LFAIRDRRVAETIADKEAREEAAQQTCTLAKSWGISLEDAENVVTYRISKDGAQFTYGGYRYDRPSAAIAYARRARTPYAR
jgi:hypothetical protein